MGYEVNYSALNKLLQQSQIKKTYVSSALQVLSESTSYVVGSSAITGKAAVGIKWYYSTTYPTISSTLDLLFNALHQQLVLYYSDYLRSVDNDGNTYFRQEYLAETRTRIQSSRSRIMEIDNDVEQTLDSIRSILSLSINGIDRIYDQHTYVNDLLDQTDNAVQALESRRMAEALSIESHISTLRLLLEDQLSRPQQFQAGIYGANSLSADLLNQLVQKNLNLQAKIKVMQKAVQTALDTIDRSSAVASNEALIERFWAEFQKKYSWDNLLDGSNYIKKIYNLCKEIDGSKSIQDFVKAGIDIFQFSSGAYKNFKGYWKIGRAVGKGKAMTWWAKSAVGLKPLGRASTAKNIFARFKGNLTNKTSPFRAQFDEVVDTFSGAKGAGKAVAAWGAVVVDGVMNFFDNKEEQRVSNGEMSDLRVIEETVMETAVGTALSYGAGIVVGAAVTTVLGTAAAPGVVVVALSGLAIAGLDAGINAITGKTATEWISDTILNTAEEGIKGAKAAGKAICSAGKKTAKWIKGIFS